MSCKYYVLLYFQLAPIKLNRYGEDLLFFLFYMNGGDLLQLAAAAELWVLVDCYFLVKTYLECKVLTADTRRQN